MSKVTKKNCNTCRLYKKQPMSKVKVCMSTKDCGGKPRRIKKEDK